jgi:hypothetical protein
MGDRFATPLGGESSVDVMLMDCSVLSAPGGISSVVPSSVTVPPWGPAVWVIVAPVPVGWEPAPPPPPELLEHAMAEMDSTTAPEARTTF